MNKELLVKICIIALLISAALFIFVTINFISVLSDYLPMGEFILMLSIGLIYAVILISSIVVSIKGWKKVRFSNYLLVLTILLPILSFYIPLYYFGSRPDSLTGAKVIAIVDYSCINNGTAQVMIRNAGTETINISGCTAAGSIGGGTLPVAICGDMTITKTTGGNMNGQLDKTSIAIGGDTIFTDPCPAGTTCTYRFVTSSAGIGPNPNVAIVEC